MKEGELSMSESKRCIWTNLSHFGSTKDRKIHILQNCHNVQKLPQWRQLAKINEMVMEKGGERHSHVSSLRTNQIRAI